MRAGREEGFDLLSKWVSERTLLECTISFPAFVARLRGRLAGFSAGEVRLLSDDTSSELALRLGPSLDFLYGDMSSVDRADKFEGALIVVFRLGDEGPADVISFTEIVP